MSTVWKVLQRDDLVVDGYIHNEILETNEKIYPTDIKTSILSFYHRPTYFKYNGPFSTINNEKNILTCKYSKWITIHRVIECSIFIVIWVVSPLVLISVCLGSFMEPELIPKLFEVLGIKIVLLIYIMIPCILIPVPVLAEKIPILTSNCCYGSVLMPSIVDKDKSIQYKYKIKILRCDDNVDLFIGLHDDEDTTLEGVPCDIFCWLDRSEMYYTIHNKDIPYIFWPYHRSHAVTSKKYGTGDVITICYDPTDSLITFRVNDGETKSITNVTKDKDTNYRLIIYTQFQWFDSGSDSVQVQLL